MLLGPGTSTHDFSNSVPVRGLFTLGASAGMLDSGLFRFTLSGSKLSEASDKDGRGCTAWMDVPCQLDLNMRA